VELTVMERVILLQILAPVTNTLTDGRILRRAKRDLGFSEEDHKEYGITPTEPCPHCGSEGGMRWEDATATKEIEIGDVAHKIIVRQLKELDRQGKIPGDYLDIYDKFPEVEE